jgi:hypothetical protein
VKWVEMGWADISFSKTFATDTGRFGKADWSNGKKGTREELKKKGAEKIHRLLLFTFVEEFGSLFQQFRVVRVHFISLFKWLPCQKVLLCSVFFLDN